MAVSRCAHLARFYSILDTLEAAVGPARALCDCTGRMSWPNRGVYFFREIGERRTDTGSGQRIVRVGTHALISSSQTTLWKRLSQHKGQSSTGGGNHRGSIFRELVGAALMKRHGYDFPSWNHGDSASREIKDAELALEREVSLYIGKMPFLWLAVEDDPGPQSLPAISSETQLLC